MAELIVLIAQWLAGFSTLETEINWEWKNIMGDRHCKVVSYVEAQSAITMIRYRVFQVEQSVEPELDFDGLDEAAIHLVAYDGDEPIGTMRIRYLDDQIAKIERVAVLPEYRGQGIGRELMEMAITFLDSQNCSKIKLNSQIQVKDFYQKLGFESSGEVFYEAGIPHITMQRSRG